METMPKIIMTRLMRYWAMELPFLRRQKVEMMKNTASQITNLLRMNMPAEHRSSDMKLAPSASYWLASLAGS